MGRILLNGNAITPTAPVGYKFIVNESELKEKVVDTVKGFKGGLPYKSISGTFVKPGVNGGAHIDLNVTHNDIGDYTVQLVAIPGKPAIHKYRFVKSGAFTDNKTVLFIQQYFVATQVGGSNTGAHDDEHHPLLERDGEGYVTITTKTEVGYTPQDWPELSFEIRVYN